MPITGTPCGSCDALRTDLTESQARRNELWKQTLEMVEQAKRPGTPEEVAALRRLASIAQDAATQFSDWIGSASTRNATTDSMYRLARALDAAGYPYNNHRCLDWRGSVLHELNDAGFFFSEEKEAFVFDPDAEKARPYRNHGNAVGPTLKEIAAQLRAAEGERDQQREFKNGAYAERNKCVVLLARMALALGYKAGVAQHEDKPGEAWDFDWRTIVFIDLPVGQVSWHFHDSEKDLLLGLPAYDGKWDGHDTPAKYARVLLTYPRIAAEEAKERAERLVADRWECHKVEGCGVCASCLNTALRIAQNRAAAAEGALREAREEAGPLRAGPLRAVVLAMEDWLPKVEMACARALAGDQKDWKTLRATLTLVVQRTQEMRAAIADVLAVTKTAPPPETP